MKMTKQIKFRNTIISGLFAGFLILIIGACLFPILGNSMDEILASRGAPPLGTGSMIFFAILSLMLGIAVITIYALFENLIESKHKTIIFVSLAFWFFTYFWSNSTLVAYGLMPLSFVAFGTLWGLLEIYIATLLGTKLYERLNRENRQHTPDMRF